MKLLLIITDYGSFNGFLAELCIDLLKKDMELHVICSKDKVIDIPDKYSYEGLKITFHILEIPRKPSILAQFKTAKQIRRIVDIVKPELVHAHFTTGIFPAVLLKKSDTPYWGTFHGLGLNSTAGIRKLLFTVVEKICFYKLDRIFVLNNQDYNLVSNLFPAKAFKYSSYGIGCDIQKFNIELFTLKQLEELKHSLNIKEQFVLAYTGRFVAFKGYNVLIRAFHLLSKRSPGSYKLIVMGGNDALHQTGLNPEELKEMVDNEDIINIGFTSEVSKYLAISDLFVFPSKKEGLPTCIVEALSMGVPVITMNERGNNDIVRNDVNGVLIHSGIEQEEILKICAAVEELKSEPDKRMQLGNYALQHRQEYSRSLFIEEHLFLYNEFKKNQIQAL